MFCDFEADVSGGVVFMVSHCEGLDKQQAIQWLVDNNFLTQNNTATATATANPQTKAYPQAIKKASRPWKPRIRIKTLERVPTSSHR